jgi:transposase InsO family protein
VPSDRGRHLAGWIASGCACRKKLKQRRGLPWQIRSDNGPEFVSRAVDQWAYEPGLQWHTIQPGRQMENCYVESFNGRFRDECLSENLFRDLADAREKITQTPVELAAQAASFYRAELGQEASNVGTLRDGTPNQFLDMAAITAS